MTSAGRTTLVTGGAGYVGAVVVDLLLRSGRSVRVLDALLHGHVSSLLCSWHEERFMFTNGDVRDAAALSQAVEGVDEIVHLASIVGDPACARDPVLAHDVNVDGTLALLSAAERAGARRFVFASTCSNYGKMTDADAYATEEWDLRPLSLYAETKVEAELAILARAHNDFATTCLRFATVYGAAPRMRFDLTVNEFTRDVVLERELVVYGEQFWRPYVHVRDAARSVVTTLDAPSTLITGEVFNVGDTSENYRKADLVELLRARRPDAVVNFVHRDEDPRDYRVSFEKARNVLGFEISRKVPNGIDEVSELVQSGLLKDPFADEYRN